MPLLSKKGEAISYTCRLLIRQNISRRRVYVGKIIKNVPDRKEIGIPGLTAHELNPQIAFTLRFHPCLRRCLNAVVNHYDSFTLGYVDLLQMKARHPPG